MTDKALDTLRDELGLTGTKEGCNDGNCGACTVNLDGRIVDSCCVLGAEIDGSTVETIEGMAEPGKLHPLQQAFLEEAALQCGICTPGFLISAKALLDTEPHPSEDRVDVKGVTLSHGLSGYRRSPGSSRSAWPNPSRSHAGRRSSSRAGSRPPRGFPLSQPGRRLCRPRPSPHPRRSQAP